MADSPRPFNSLGQILSSGGEIYAAYQLRRGMSVTDTIQKIEHKFAPTDDPTARQVVDFARGGMSSGDYLSTLERGDAVDYQMIQKNQFLFRSNTARGRFFVGASYGPGGGQMTKDINIILPSEITIDFLYQSIALQLESWMEKYPERFMEFVNQDPSKIQIIPWFAEGMF